MNRKLDPLKEDWYVLEPHSLAHEPEEKQHTPNPETMEWVGLHVILPILVGTLSAVIASRLARGRDGRH